MTVSNLISQSSKLSDESFSTSEWVIWFNDALNDLLEYLYIESKTTLTKLDTDEGFVLPSNFKTEIRVGTVVSPYNIIDINDATSIGYKKFDGVLYLQGVTGINSLELLYYKIPTKFSPTNTGTEIDFPDEYLEAIKLFACKRACTASDELTRADIFEEQYITKKRSIISMSAKKRPARIGNWRVVR